MSRSRAAIIGTLRVSRGGTAFVVPEDGGPEILLARSSGHRALAGDRVEALVKETRWGPRGRVVDVIEPRAQGALGTLEKSGRGYRVALDRRDLPAWLNVSRSSLGGAEIGDRVWVGLLRDGSGACLPNCVVNEVLGPADDPGTDFRAVALQFGLPEGFSGDVLNEAAGACFQSEESGDRRDFRDEILFTIDPEDAKDHDDALSFKELPDGRFEVGVHIADVSHFVHHGGALDLAAKERGSSVYLCDGVLPMLPPRLSEDLCSLVPDCDRPTLSAIFVMDSSADVRSCEIVQGVVRSKARLSYEGAQAYIEASDRSDPLGSALFTLALLAAHLADRRAVKGALDLEILEPKVLLDERGNPTEVSRGERLDSHRVIEEFMLLANEAVAEVARREKIPFVYRVHPSPKTERLDELALKLGELGGRFRASSVRKGRDMERPLALISDRQRRALGAYLVIRAMERARYAPKSGQHFGLACDCYCHFTSPIRRYPDLYNHRALRQFLCGGAGRKTWDPDDVAESSSSAEERAAAAERESVTIKCIRFMEGKLGGCFAGMVTGVASRGYFVELDDHPIEGFARVKAEPRSRRGRAGLFLGDRVRVRVLRADPHQRELDFAIIKKSAKDTD